MELLAAKAAIVATVILLDVDLQMWRSGISRSIRQIDLEYRRRAADFIRHHQKW